MEASAIQIPKEEVPSGPPDDSCFILVWFKIPDVKTHLDRDQVIGIIRVQITTIDNGSISEYSSQLSSDNLSPSSLLTGLCSHLHPNSSFSLVDDTNLVTCTEELGDPKFERLLGDTNLCQVSFVLLTLGSRGKD